MTIECPHLIYIWKETLHVFVTPPDPDDMLHDTFNRVVSPALLAIENAFQKKKEGTPEMEKVGPPKMSATYCTDMGREVYRIDQIIGVRDEEATREEARKWLLRYNL